MYVLFLSFYGILSFNLSFIVSDFMTFVILQLKEQLKRKALDVYNFLLYVI